MKTDSVSPCKHCDGERYRTPSGKLRCPTCANARGARWYQKNITAARAARTKYRHENKGELKKWHRAYDRAESIRKPLIRTWKRMVARCHTATDTNYKHYGRRGISVCDRWRYSYQNFEDDMLPTWKQGLTIDRYPDINGNYEPGNVRWATWLEQCDNKRSSVKYKLSIPDDTEIEYLNTKMTLSRFSEITRMDIRVAKYRYVDAGIKCLDDITRYITDPFISGRDYRYMQIDYTLTELSIISGIPIDKLHSRLKKHNWSVAKAIDRLDE